VKIGLLVAFLFPDNVSSHRSVKPIIMILVVKNLSVNKFLSFLLSKTVQELTPKIILWDFQRVLLEA